MTDLRVQVRLLQALRRSGSCNTHWSRRLLLVFKLDGLATIFWEEHLLPLSDIDRYELAILQVSSSWADRHN